jgi:hypothetical protein
MRRGLERPLAVLLDEYAQDAAPTDDVITARDREAEAVGRHEVTGKPFLRCAERSSSIWRHRRPAVLTRRSCRKAHRVEARRETMPLVIWRLPHPVRGIVAFLGIFAVGAIVGHLVDGFGMGLPELALLALVSAGAALVVATRTSSAGSSSS